MNANRWAPERDPADRRATRLRRLRETCGAPAVAGGAYDFFVYLLQSLDGYDVVNNSGTPAVGAHDRVGMLGISFGGISQLFVAATRPPSLAAITPLSVIDNTLTTLYPGGVPHGLRPAWAEVSACTTPSRPY